MNNKQSLEGKCEILNDFEMISQLRTLTADKPASKKRLIYFIIPLLILVLYFRQQLRLFLTSLSLDKREQSGKEINEKLGITAGKNIVLT